MEPGHRQKGKQCWITCCEDLQDMYKDYSMKKEILLWYFLPGKGGAVRKKRSNDTGEAVSKKHSMILVMLISLMKNVQSAPLRQQKK